MTTTAITRRHVLVGSGGVLLATGTPLAARPSPLAMTVYKDPQCGCCTAWADILRRDARYAVRVVATDMAAVKRRLRVPADLASCHTAVAGGYVFEGHVPSADVARLLATRPRGVIGIAVPGMPAGSPGMETPDGRRDAFEVVAFKVDRTRGVFARHG